MRYHVLTQSKGTTINITGHVDLFCAHFEHARRVYNAVEHNKQQRETYFQRLKDQVLDENPEDDSTPDLSGPVRVDYAFKIEECKDGDSCIPCYEAGLLKDGGVFDRHLKVKGGV